MFSSAVLWYTKHPLCCQTIRVCYQYRIRYQNISIILCLAGTYKSAQRAEACTDCEQGKSSGAVGEMANSTCLDCPMGSNSPAGSSALTNCTCDAGSTGQDRGSCSQCQTGTYKTSTGAHACSNCGKSKYSAAVGAAT
jgi:hypothetical protein